MKYQLINLDVWGNKEDGYEVNQSFPTSEAIEIPFYDLMEDEARDIIDILNQFALRDVEYNQVILDYRGDVIDVLDAESEMPLYTLLPVDKFNEEEIKTVFRLDKYRSVHPLTKE